MKINKVTENNWKVLKIRTVQVVGEIIIAHSQSYSLYSCYTHSHTRSTRSTCSTVKCFNMRKYMKIYVFLSNIQCIIEFDMWRRFLQQLTNWRTVFLVLRFPNYSNVCSVKCFETNAKSKSDAQEIGADDGGDDATTLQLVYMIWIWEDVSIEELVTEEQMSFKWHFVFIRIYSYDSWNTL